MKNILLVLFLLFSVGAKAGSPVIFQGTYGKFIPADGLRFADEKTIISNAVDPSSVATPGDPGSLYLGDLGILYIKQDSGTTTNWEALPFTSDLTDYAYLPGRAGGQILIGGTASGDDLTLRSTSDVTKGSILIDESTASTTTSTGALVVTGGVGVGGSVNIGSNLAVDTDLIFTDASTNRLGINNGTPAVALDVVGAGLFSGALSTTDTTDSTTTTTGALLSAGGLGVAKTANFGDGINIGVGSPLTYGLNMTTQDMQNYIWVSSYGNDPTYVSSLYLGHPRGTVATPTATQTADALGEVVFFGYDTNLTAGGAIRAFADSLWGSAGDSTDAPTRLSFWTAPDGSDTLTERMRINNAGNVGIGTVNPLARVHINATMIIDQGSAPATPSANDNIFYTLADDNFYMKDDNGVEQLIGGYQALSGSNTTLASYPTTAGQYGDVASASVPAGIWQMTGTICFENNGAITATGAQVGISSTSGNSATGLLLGLTTSVHIPIPTANGDQTCIHTPVHDVTVGSTTTYYLKSRVITSITNLRYTYSYLFRRMR